MPDIKLKICGLSRQQDVDASCAAGADCIGFVFFPKSPRNIAISTASALARSTPVGVERVALVVNPDDAFLDRLVSDVPIDVLQLHGSEPPERVAEVRARYGLPVMKAVGVSNAADLPALDAYARVADRTLVDAKPAPGARLPGGNGLSFDWSLLQGRDWPGPWMLAGGLTPQNVAEAQRLTGATQFDVSSGVESAPGVKDPDRIRAFIAAARGI